MGRNTDNSIIYLVTFFLMSGYYLGLSFFFNLGIAEFSRYYTVSLRFILLLIMLYYILKASKNVEKNSIISTIFVFFSILYIFKILYTANTGNNTSLQWYEYVFYYISYVFVPFWFFSFVNLHLSKDIIINATISSGFLLSVVSVYIFREVLTSGGIGRISQLSEITGEEIISPLVLSYSGALTILFCIYKLLYYRDIKIGHKVYLYFTIILSFTIFFLGATRGALLFLVFGTICLILFTNLRRKLLLVISLICSMPLVIFILDATGSALLERTTDATQGDTSGRDVLWSEALAEFWRNPILGGMIEVSGIYPHNIFIEVLMATGILGGILIGLIIIKTIRTGIILVKINPAFIVAVLLTLNGLILQFFSGALWTSILLFAGVGLLNKNYNIEYKK
ncbi:O-antigen ligase family protein [Chryseobacterium lacus]|uniref:O-antigen ligase family protein n=1 Tax=Chryseobacterium lacus TaxID=2058346 RepID=UPI000F88D063|nr:O-antigen ligase family protein [Chryseobacterium lacus]RST26689.1 O-antigen ligase domain-containing protein [Chryseobacterium lacus]